MSPPPRMKVDMINNISQFINMLKHLDTSMNILQNRFLSSVTKINSKAIAPKNFVIISASIIITILL